MNAKPTPRKHSGNRRRQKELQFVADSFVGINHAKNALQVLYKILTHICCSMVKEQQMLAQSLG